MGNGKACLLNKIITNYSEMILHVSLCTTRNTDPAMKVFEPGDM